MPWWRDAVVYQIYPRSFADANGDGVGDLEGIRRHLDHLQWLGVDAIWISPFYRSPMADGGYDVSDYCDVDPVFGDLATFDRLLAEAHERGLRVVVDWVPNHTSSEHPWFLESRSSRDSPKRPWYIWRDGPRDRPPNNWRAAFGGPAWTWDEATEQWYLHLFLPEQPDLNWGHPDVVVAMHGTLRFWLDRGVDGFRMDVVHLIGKDPALPDQAAELGPIDRVGIHDDPRTHELLRGIRAVLDEYPGERVSVGEVNLTETIRIARYYGDDDELHLSFNFLSLDAGWSADAWRTLVETVGAELPVSAWPTWVLSNHDQRRHRTRLGGSERRARALAVLLLSLRGTPFLYAGEELGLEDAHVPPERIVDPAGRDGCRAPVPWSAEPPHGWDGAEPWLPWPPEPERRNVERLAADEGSILHLYRRLLRLRRTSEALRRGSLRWLGAPTDVLAFVREQGSEEVRVAVNFGDGPVRWPLEGDWRVHVSSAPDGLTTDYAGVLPPEAAVVMVQERARSQA
jgi:alpha-glucosidase